MKENSVIEVSEDGWDNKKCGNCNWIEMVNCRIGMQLQSTVINAYYAVFCAIPLRTDDWYKNE
jgi:hypothetical protein